MTARKIKGKEETATAGNRVLDAHLHQYDSGIEARFALAARLWDWVPHGGQREFLTLRLENGDEPKVLIAACGRRWGKTECLGMDVATRILTQPDLGQMGVAPTRDQAEGLFDSVEEKLRSALDGDGDEEKAEQTLAEFPHLAYLEIKRSPYPLVRRKDTGQMVFWVRAAGRKGRNLRGRGTTRKLTQFRVIIDECAFVDEGAIEEAIKPMLATSPGGGGQLVMISSPYGKRGSFYADYLRGERGENRYRAVRLPSSQNPLVDAGFLAAMEVEMLPSRFRSEFLAEFVDSAGAVFLADDIAACTVGDDYGTGPLWGSRYVAGIDFGRRADWTVVQVLEVGPVPRLVELWRVQGLGWHAQVERVVEVLLRWGVCALCCDATGVGDSGVSETLQAALDAKRIACAVEPFVFTGASKSLLIDALAIAVSRGRLRFPPHPVLLSELSSFEATPSPFAGGRERLQARTGHDDAVCALALALRAAAPWTSSLGASTVHAVAAGRRLYLGDSDSHNSLWTEETEETEESEHSFAVSTDAHLHQEEFTCSEISSKVRVVTSRERAAQRLLQSVYRFGLVRWAGARAIRSYRAFLHSRLR